MESTSNVRNILLHKPMVVISVYLLTQTTSIKTFGRHTTGRTLAKPQMEQNKSTIPRNGSMLFKDELYLVFLVLYPSPGPI